ncbi:restriction endonuclease subunit S [Teichococcus aerofrigidensis]
MRTKNVQDKLDLSDVWGIPRSFARRADQILREGDILISSANSWNLVGKCCWVPALESPGTFGGFVTVLRADPRRAHARYLYRWLSSDPIQATLRSFGRKTTSISNLDLGRTLDLTLNLPSLEEQRRIAAILDEADALRAKRRAALAQLDEMARAIFVEMFGDPDQNPRMWPILPLGSLIADGPQNGLYRPASDYGDGAPILRIDSFYDGVVTGMQKLKRLRISDAEQSLYALRPGDIVVNRVNSMEYLGKSALIPDLPEPTVFESNMMRFSLDPGTANPRFVIEILQTEYIKRQIRCSAKHAVNQSSINQKDVASFQIICPPLGEQVSFATRLTSLDRIKEANLQAIAMANSLFSSLQHRAFRGEL